MKKIMYYPVFVLLLVCFSACSRKMTFARSVVVPAAEGGVKIKKDRNNNYAITVSVRNLASARNLQPPKQTYVVWMQTKDDGTRNIGQLNSSSGLLSKTLKGSLSTVSSHKPTSFFITAEDVGDVQHPGTQTVLVTER
jgi:hypothetical protein